MSCRVGWNFAIGAVTSHRLHFRATDYVGAIAFPLERLWLEKQLVASDKCNREITGCLYRGDKSASQHAKSSEISVWNK